jgi:hypothetical protein
MRATSPRALRSDGGKAGFLGSITMRATSDKQHSPRLGATGLAVLAAAAATGALAVAAHAAPRSSIAAPCTFVAKGAPWSFKGQKGTAYTVVAEAGAKCSTARSWIPRLTHEHASFDLKPVPAGWHCSTIGGVTTGLTKSGQCTTAAGGIVEWLPKLK